MSKKIGKYSIKFNSPISIVETASIVGNKEGEGPLKDTFDKIIKDSMFGQDTWEKAESNFVNETIKLLFEKTKLKHDEVDYIIAGDLLNQSTGSTFGIRSFEIPYFGVYSACSNISEAISLASILIDGDFAEKIIVNASSHFCSAEKQFRSPLELGNQRPQTSTWTVTGDGAMLLSKKGVAPYIKKITTGKIVDLGVNDPFNMGAAMAPAAADTIYNHLFEFNLKEDYYDLIITGDLGYFGLDILKELLHNKGLKFRNNLSDCGIKIFDRETQDTHAGGSGCACSAVTFSGYIFSQLKKKELNKILFVPTGALLSSTSVLQSESIPGIAHAIAIENE